MKKEKGLMKKGRSSSTRRNMFGVGVAKGGSLGKDPTSPMINAVSKLNRSR